MKNIERDFREGLNKLKKETFYKGCFHQDENCSPKIIRAHSIQNNRILNRISENGEVLYSDFSLYSTNSRLKWKLKEKGRKTTSTFTGFCEYHDRELFKSIELYDYQIGDEEQNFLFAYRALAREYHAKKSATQVAKRQIRFLDNTADFKKYFSSFEKPEEPYLSKIKELLREYLKGCRESLSNLEKYRTVMNINLERNRTGKIITDTIELDNEYHIAVSSGFYIERDINGKTINDLGNKNNLNITFLTIFPQNGKTYVLFSYFRKNRHLFKFIKEQIINKEQKEQKIIVSNIIAQYTENFVISPTSWENLTKSKKELFENLFSNTLHEKFPILVPFRKLDIFV